MSANFLEDLIAQWYEYQGYFVRRNILVGPREKGGYECELDIVAFHPETKHLVHVEPSTDALSWAKRETRFRKKFEAGRRYIPALFEGFDIPEQIEQMVVLVFASKQTHQTVAGCRLVLASELLVEIFEELEDKRLASSAVREHLPILRAFQFVSEYRDAIMQVWKSEG